MESDVEAKTVEIVGNGGPFEVGTRCSGRFGDRRWPHAQAEGVP